MNNPLQTSAVQISQSRAVYSSALQGLFDQIAEGAAERERERILPYDVVDLIREARFGALRIPVSGAAQEVQFVNFWRLLSGWVARTPTLLTSCAITSASSSG